MAQAHIRSPGRWQIITPLPIDPNGRRLQHSETFRGTQEGAEARVAQLLESLNNNEPAGHSETTE